MRISDWSSDVCSSDLLLKGGLYRPLIGRNGNVLARLGDVEIGRIAPEIEDREDKRRTKAPRLAVIAEQIVEIGRGVAEAARQADAREEGGAGRADIGVGGEVGRASWRERMYQTG